MEICWKILRHFGYDDKLSLEQGLIEDNTVSSDALSASRSIELNQGCVLFLVKMFKANENPKTNKLDMQAIDRVFAPTETGKCPWNVASETVYEIARARKDIESTFKDETEKTGEGITLENWIGLWIKYFNIDPMAAFRDLVLIGYCNQLKDAIHLVKFKPKDI